MRKFILFNSKLFQRLQSSPQMIFYGKRSKDLNVKKKAVDKLVHQPLELNYRVPTMDDMLVPSGSWEAHHKKRNAHYNTVLIFGLVSLIGSIFILQKTVFFNAFPPPYPFVIDKEEEENKHDRESES